jgi:amino-acid N-acetyltransferase
MTSTATSKGLFTVRPANTGDVQGIRAILQPFVERGVMLGKETVQLYEDIQEFEVAVDPKGKVVGCGALHVMWLDLAEVRTVVVAEEARGQGVGHAIVEELIGKARALKVKRIFCLTFETGFFGSHGFEPISENPVDDATYEEMLLSTDDGVAEFLDLARVKQNTLGNTRMLKLI